MICYCIGLLSVITIAKMQSVGVQGVVLVEVFPLYIIIRAGSSDDW